MKNNKSKIKNKKLRKMHCNFSKKIENDTTDVIIKFKQKEIIEKNHVYDYFIWKFIFMRKCDITFISRFRSSERKLYSNRKYYIHIS